MSDYTPEKIADEVAVGHSLAGQERYHERPLSAENRQALVAIIEQQCERINALEDYAERVCAALGKQGAEMGRLRATASGSNCDCPPERCIDTRDTWGMYCKDCGDFIEGESQFTWRGKRARKEQP